VTGRTSRLGAVLLPLVIMLTGCGLMERISEGEYRNAVADGTAEELAERGTPVGERPVCVTPSTGTEAVVRIHCTARTTTGAHVEVSGQAARADTDRPSEDYVITVNGREVLRRNCLGAGCYQAPMAPSKR
jgi:hypothetical protein